MADTEVRKLREAADLSQREAADVLDIPLRTLQAYDRGEREPPYKKMDRIRRVLGERAGDGDVGDTPTSEVVDLPMSTDDHGGSAHRTTSLPLVSISASAGDASHVWDVTIERYMEVDTSILSAETGTRAGELAVFPVSGDSMYDTIRAGDKVVVHIQQPDRIVEGVVYVWMGAHQGVVIKRAHWVSDTVLELVSDNERYSPIRVTEDERDHWQCVGQIKRVMRAV